MSRQFSKSINPVNLHRSMVSNYNAAIRDGYTRARHVPAYGSDADYHVRNEFEFIRMREYARDMDRNDTVIGQGVNRAVDNILGDGFRYQPQTGDPELNQILAAKWKRWAEDEDQCHAAREHNFHQLERLVLRAQFVDGDIIALPINNGKIDLIEAHRLRSPSYARRNIALGVELADNREHLKYYITREDVDPNSTRFLLSDFLEIPARDSDDCRNAFLVRSVSRVSQTRGVTAFAPIFKLATMHEDAQFAALVKQVVSCCFAVMHTYDMADPRAQKNVQEGDRDTRARNEFNRILEGIYPGKEYFAEEGEKIEGFSPNVPGNNFFEHVKLILRMIAVNLGLPYMLLLLDSSDTNFSGYRAELDQAMKMWKQIRLNLVSEFHQHVVKFKIRQWLSEDPALRVMAEGDGVNVFGHNWIFPANPYIEPVKDITAETLRINNNLSSPRRVLGERQVDHREIITETVEDNAFAIRTAMAEAQRINEEYRGVEGFAPLTWRELLTISQTDALALAALGMADTPAEPANRRNTNAPDN